jgi:outer membrane protein assembly factor BamD (BamD/ComL family)
MEEAGLSAGKEAMMHGKLLRHWVRLFFLCFVGGCAAWRGDPLGGVSTAGLEDAYAKVAESLSPKNVKRRTLTAIGLGPDEKIAQAAYDEGDALFSARNFEEAEKKYKKAAFRWPESALEEDALFMVAQCQYFRDRYSKSFDTLTGELLKDYPNTRHLDTVSKMLFAMGDHWNRRHLANPHWPTTPNLMDRDRPYFDTGGHALKAFQTIMESDSTGPLADDAVMQLANGYFTRGRYNDAADYFQMLRHQYPRSEHQYLAHLLGLQCELNRYQGPQYDGRPLESAEKLIDQLVTQFPDQVGPERERILEQKKYVVMQKALRDYSMAEYYEQRGHNLAARQYYQGVINEFPGTPMASESNTRLASLEGLPDHEPNWVAKVQKGTVNTVAWWRKEAPEDGGDPFPAPGESLNGPSQIAQNPAPSSSPNR